MRKLFKLLIILALLTTSGSSFALARLTNILYSASNNRTHITLDLSERVKIHYFNLQNPKRLVIDLDKTKLLTHPKKIKNPMVKDIRIAIHKGTGLRIVIDLTRKVLQQDYSVRKSDIHGHQVLITLHHRITESSTRKIKQTKNPPTVKLDNTVIKRAATKPTSIKKAKAKKVISKNPAVITTRSHRKQLRDHKIHIVIDPGHGGKDPGTIGERGTYEKNIVLAIAKDMKKIFAKDPRFEIKLTRTGDYYIPLVGRLEIAHKDHADMFVSVHADAYKNHKARGASVFALSQHGATSEAARYLAAEENKSEFRYERLGDIRLSNKSQQLRSVLINLAQTNTILQSLVIGTDVIHQLTKVTDVHNHHVEQAAFVVLKSPDIPSILVETGFLSNPKEELELRNPKHREKIARAIVKGIEEYFAQHTDEKLW